MRAGMIKSRTLDKKDKASLLIEYWKQSTQVQQHFNDVSMKVRNFAVVVFSAFLTGVGLSIHKSIFIDISGWHLNAAVLFSFAGLLATQLIHFMDTYWYHVFLKSAVAETLKLEEEIKKVLHIESLAGAIKSGSGQVVVTSFLGKVPLPLSYSRPFRALPDFLFSGREANSSLRHKIFYRWLIGIIIFTGIACAFIQPSEIKEDNPSRTERIIKASSRYIISGDNVRLRSEPSDSSDILIKLEIGQVIQILHDSNSSWVKVHVLKNQISTVGFVHKDFIDTLKE